MQTNLIKVEQHAEKSRVVHEFKGFIPRGSQTWLFRVKADCIHSPLEQQQYAVHDSHDQVWRFSQLTHCCNVCRLDCLKKQQMKMRPVMLDGTFWLRIKVPIHRLTPKMAAMTAACFKLLSSSKPALDNLGGALKYCSFFVKNFSKALL